LSADALILLVLVPDALLGEGLVMNGMSFAIVFKKFSIRNFIGNLFLFFSQIVKKSGKGLPDCVNLSLVL